jgi:hypothetical protein
MEQGYSGGKMEDWHYGHCVIQPMDAEAKGILEWGIKPFSSLILWGSRVWRTS